MMRRLAWLATHGRWNPGWRQRLTQIEGLARATPEALARWQGDALRTHIAWATGTLPYYRSRAPTVRRLSELPVLTRADLQAHREDLRDPSLDPETLRLDATGGSTGEPVRFYHDQAYDLTTFCTELLMHKWWGVTPWSRVAYIWGDDRELAQIPRKQKLQEWLQGRAHLNAFTVDEIGIKRFARKLRRFRPHIIMGYATALDLLAAHVLRDGGAPIRPRVVRSAAESLFPDRRARIEEAFGVQVADVYGSRESAGLAAQCRHGGFHVMSHAKVLELVDDTGKPVPAGEPGRVLLTDLANRAFGFLRYENGDVASWSEDPEPCACGCPYPRLAAVHGRSSDFISTPSGLRVHGEWFTHLFYGREDVRRFQLRQTSLDRVILLTEGAATEAGLNGILSQIRERLGAGVTVVWQGVDVIDPGSSGKHRFTVSDVPFLPEARTVEQS